MGIPEDNKAAIKATQLQEFLPIGSVFQSFLAYEQLPERTRSCWLPCDGRSCSGSKYSEITGSKNVPDCRGRFLRTQGNNSAALGASQAAATAVNGLKNHDSCVDRGGVEASSSLEKLTIEGSGIHEHDVLNHDYSWGDNRRPEHGQEYANRANATVSGDAGKPYHKSRIGPSGDHVHAVRDHKHSVEVRFTGKASAAAQRLTGDSETRPVNITVNTFIRVN